MLVRTDEPERRLERREDVDVVVVRRSSSLDFALLFLLFPFSTAKAGLRVDVEIGPMDPNSDFSDEQLGKRVVADDGTEIGVVKEVREGTLYVEVGADPNPDTIDELGWGGVVNQSIHELKRQFIGMITDETIRLSV